MTNNTHTESRTAWGSFGAGIFVTGGASVSFADVRVDANQQSCTYYARGTGVYLADSSLEWEGGSASANETDGWADYGGGAYFEASTVNLLAVEIIGNSLGGDAALGAGLSMADSDVGLTNVVIAGNAAIVSSGCACDYGSGGGL